jgi:hopene-associated glycosyltransferase HpnB
VYAGAAASIGLLVFRGRFWDARADRLRLPLGEGEAPAVQAVVPARNEADVIERTLSSLVAQQYPGRLEIVVVDDRSEDGTGAVARATIARLGAGGRARVVEGRPRPPGWTGKVWALATGVAAARSSGSRPAYWWFSDADVEHDSQALSRLVATALEERRTLVSEMVELHCVSGWERLLIPAFVFFFRMLYPFAWVNDPRRATAGAAGGCLLLADDALVGIGGVERIAGELIDDCSLAAAVQNAGGGLWLSLSTRSRSVRPYDGLAGIWSMIARTAYTQLAYSPALLAGTVAAMVLVFVVPPLAAIAGALTRRWDVALPGAIGWGALTIAYTPTLKLYRIPRLQALALPVAAALYTAMTIDSARRHARGRGGTWKGRDFTPSAG